MDVGGSSGSSSSSSTSTPTLPSELRGILGGRNPYGSNIAQMLRQTLGELPNPGQYINNMPLQGVAPLTDSQNTDIGNFQNIVSSPDMLNPEQEAAYQTYQTLASGVNPAVQYGQKVFNDMVAPTVSSQMALAGLGNSGALGENLAMAGEQMALPMAQQGYNMMATGAQGEAQMGSAAISNLSNALQAAGIPQQEAQSILNALYQQGMNKTQAGLGLEGNIANWLPALIGNQTNTSGSNSNFSASGMI